jgi:hypothetical protein
VTDRPRTPDELAALLDRFHLEHARAKDPSELGHAHVQQLLSRIAALTEVVGDGTPEISRLGCRILLDDLTIVAAHFRAHTNAMRSSLAKALGDLRASLVRCEKRIAE